MRRNLLPVLLLALAGPAFAAPLLNVRGELSSRGPVLTTGEFHQAQKVNVEAGVLVSLKVTGEGFPPYLVPNTPDGRRFTRGVSGAERQVQLDFLTTTAGSYQIAVTSEKPGQRGTFVLDGQARPVRGAVAGLQPLLNHLGDLRDTDQDLGEGRRADTHTVAVQAGQVIRVLVDSAAFDAYLAVTPPGAARLTADDVSNKNPEIAFLATTSGDLPIMVLGAEAKGRGAYRLQVFGGTLAGGASPAATATTALLTDQEMLGPDSARLDSGEWGRVYGVNLTAGQSYILQVEAQGFQPRILAVLPDGKEVDQRASGVAEKVEVLLTATRTGLLRFCVAGTRTGVGGSFRLTVQPPAAAAVTTTQATAATATTASSAKTLGAKPRDPRLPAVPKFQGTTLADLTGPAFKLTVPQPLPATVANPGVLANTLHQMNYLRVQAGGWSEMNETNWLYPLADVTRHGSPRYFFADPDNQFTDADGAYTMPLQWSGNVFTCQHRKQLDARGSLEMLDVTGTVSPDGDRVEWVLIREYVQSAYWNEAEQLALLSHRRYNTISLVDLPLRNPYYNAENGSGLRHVTLQKLLTGQPADFVLRNGLHYGFDAQPEAGQHVLDLGYLEQDPAVREAKYIDREKIHTVEYRSTVWGHPTNRSTAKVSFERRKNVRP